MNKTLEQRGSLLDALRQNMAKLIRAVIGGYPTCVAYAFDERGLTRRGVEASFLWEEFDFTNARPLFDYLPLREDIRADFYLLWNRKLAKGCVDLYVDDLDLFMEGLLLYWKELPKHFGISIMYFCCFGTLFSDLSEPILLLCSTVS